MELIKEIVIKDPPTKWTLKYKRPKYDINNKLIEKTDFYLTGNLFYSGSDSMHLTRKIVHETKEYLYEFMKGLPEIEKMRLEFQYHSMKHIDLDNKASFWIKLFLDILKTPTERQIKNSIKHKRVIITTNTIQDDNTKCIDEINLKFVKGEHLMIFRVFGRVKSEQKELDLFFI